MNDALLTIEKLYSENRETIDMIKNNLNRLEELQRTTQNPLKVRIFKGIHDRLNIILGDAVADEVEIIDRIPLNHLIENSL